jgi:hypothetical protein
MRGLAVAAVTDEAGVTALASALQCLNDASLAEFRFRAAVKLNEVYMVGF